MSKEIKQICQKINPHDILNKKFYPVWFFTNERINYFFPKLKNNRWIKKIFSIGGSGDFAFSILSSQKLNQVSEINLCDIRPMANISIDFKLALFKNLEHEEILDLLLKRKPFSKKETYKRFRETMTLLSKKVFDFIIESCQEDNFLNCLRKSGFWYKHSFWQIKNRGDYLPYLISREDYQLLRRNLNKITIYCGDLNDNLKLFPDGYYDLIYVSNIFDSKRYCLEPNLYLETINVKLNQNGLLFVATQQNPKKMIKLINDKGLRIYEKQLHRFNIISSLFGHYSYSFLLFRKGNF